MPFDWEGLEKMTIKQGEDGFLRDKLRIVFFALDDREDDTYYVSKHFAADNKAKETVENLSRKDKNRLLEAFTGIEFGDED